MNKKGFATSTIVFALLSVFLISISILLVTITNTNRTKNALNEKVVSNIEYGNSSINDIEQRLEELENTTLKLDNVYPVGSIYMSNNLKTVEEVHNALGGTWEKYSEGRTIIGDGTSTDVNGNVTTYKIGETGGNSNVSNISIEHIHTYDKTTSGTYSTIISHKHSTNSYTITRDNLTSDTIIFGDVQNYNHKTNNALHFSTGKWGYYGGETAEAVPLYMTTYAWGKPIDIGDTSVVGNSSGSISLKYSSVNTSNMNTNNKIDAQDPYIVTYIYKRVK